MHLDVYENAFRDTSCKRSAFDFSKQPSRKDFVKHESATSIDLIPTTCIVKNQLASSSKGLIKFSQTRERDESLYTNGMTKNIELENTKEERAKIIQERKQNRHKYRSELQTKLYMCNKLNKDNKKYEIGW